METLASHQIQLRKEIEKLSKTYATDSPDKKTIAYLHDKLNTLNSIWNKFEDGDNQIREKYSSHTYHQYFTTDCYDIVKEEYEKLKIEIEKLISVVEHHKKTIQTPIREKNDEQIIVQKSPVISKDEVIEKLIRKQKMGMFTLNNTLTKILAMSDVQPEQFYVVKYDTITSQWKEIEENHKTIWEEVIDPSAYGYDLTDYCNIQEKYENVLIKIANERSMMENERQSTVTTNLNSHNLQSIHTVTNQTMLKLPKIQLPKFDGNYLKWQQFYDLFNQMVHCQPMGNAQKMFYLKANLSGEAERLIRHIPVTDENYMSTWDILIKRYANKRLLVTALIDKMLHQPVILNESAIAIKTMHNVTKECILGLENLGLAVYNQWDPMVLHILARKLDRNTHTLYEQSLKSPRELQTVKHFLEFLELRFQSLEALGQKRVTEKNKQNKVTTHTAIKVNKLRCNYCSKDHAIYYCEQFLTLSVQERQAAAKKLNLCLNCLKQGHRTAKCSARGCVKCHFKHNSLLHTQGKENIEAGNSNQYNETSSHVSTSTNLSAQAEPKVNSYVFLGTAVATIMDGQGNPVKCRVLLDSGSQVNFITERLRKKLKIITSQDELNISGIGQSKVTTNDKMNIKLESRVTKYDTRLEAYVIKEITTNQPQQFINISGWNIPQDLQLADPEFNKPDKVDVLIGAELYGEIMLNGKVKLGEKLPILQNTTLGWIILGKVCTTKYARPFCGVSNAELSDQMRKFWELEECTSELTMSSIDKRCEDFFKSTVMRNKQGRFIVNMPIFTDPALLGDSWNIAHRRFLNMEKKLIKQPELYHQYREFLAEYLSAGHMREITNEEIPDINYFLPHHYVLKPTSTTTKLRVVFDASAKTTSNLSLNDLMVAGPRIQDELFDIILRFRTHKYVFTADIAQMYRQILMNEEDRNLQLILWRNKPDEPIRYFQLCTVTYGTKAAPYLATRCLKQLAIEEEIRYPLAAEFIKDFYVDDIITGHDSLTQAVKIRNELDAMMKTGGFKLRKWCANHPSLLRGLPKEDLGMQIDFGENAEGNIKTLGMTWDPKRDYFQFTANWPERSSVSKRTVLADMSHLFDPLGLVNPVIVLGKIFMQQLWRLNYDWDDELPDNLKIKWVNFREGLVSLNNLKIDRHVILTNAEQIELHAFADASEKAYGTAVYLRTVNNKKEISVKLLCARSRVAPVKIVTLPRLELCAARLASQLVQKILKVIKLKIDKIHYWSDSQITLSWIHGNPASLKTFVGNRVQKIQEVSSPSQWRYIQTKLNPADLVSRGLAAHQLATSELWFYGPTFLQHDESRWPNLKFEMEHIPSEEKQMKIVLNCNKTSEGWLLKINHGNSFGKLQRIVAYVLRSVKLFKKLTKREQMHEFLQVNELEEALKVIVREAQNTSFKEDIENLKKKGQVHSSSKLATLVPFLDQDGLLRVGGRLEKADIAYGAKHPLLMAGDHIFSKLMMNELHTRHLHAGPQALVAISRQKFWVTQGRNLARMVVNSCVQCVRAKPQLMNQLMGNLPATRVLPGRPFLTTGVDFCGPIWTHFKVRGKRPQKTYLAVFCCFATKAVHLEVVSDLSTEAFLGALKRFVARRGYCQNIYCDNATNFVGANNQLQEVHQILQKKESQQKIIDICSQRRIQFHFIPPRSPHFGGLWEAAVKSFKQLFTRTVKSASLTYEELTTVAAEIEAILNSRPLTPMSSDPNDYTALTPGHFLVGEPLTVVPDPEITASNLSSLSRWKLVSSIRQEFWRRWTAEYLGELQRRLKWTKLNKDIKLGMLVIIRDNNLPPLKWPMGRIVNIEPGTDGLIRVVDVKTATGTYRRAIHNLCPLPVEPDDTTATVSENNDDSDQQLQQQSSKRINEGGSKQGSKKRKMEAAMLGKLII